MLTQREVLGMVPGSIPSFYLNMRNASRSPLRPVTPRRADDTAQLKTENERLKSEMAVLKEMCASERLKSQELSEKLSQTSEFKFSVETQLHQELKRNVETNNRLRDELRKREIANAEMAVRLSEHEQKASKIVEEFRLLGDTLSSRTDKLVRLEKEYKLLGRQHEERQRLLDSVAAEKSALLREGEAAQQACRELLDEKERMSQQLKAKTDQLATAMHHFGQDRDLLVWESASRTRVLAAARVHSALLQVFRVQKRIGYHGIRLAASRSQSLRKASLVLIRSIKDLRSSRKRVGFEAMRVRDNSSAEDWGIHLRVARMKRAVVSQWRVLSNRRRKCRIVLRLFLQATHKVCMNSKKSFLREGWRAIQLTAKSNHTRLQVLASALRITHKLQKRKALQFLKFQAFTDLQERRRVLNKVFYALVLNRQLEQQKGNLTSRMQNAETGFERKTGLLLAAKDLGNCLNSSHIRHLALAWTAMRSTVLLSRECRKRVLTAGNIIAHMKEIQTLWLQQRVFQAWHQVKLRLKLDSLSQEMETEKPLRQHYQDSYQQSSRDLQFRERQQALRSLIAILTARSSALRASAFSRLRTTLLSKHSLRKISLLFRHSLSQSFTTWRKKVYELNLLTLCQDQAKDRVYNETLIEHMGELETVIEQQAQERQEMIGRVFGRLCGRMESNWRRNWLDLWHWIAQRNGRYRTAAKRIAGLLVKAGKRGVMDKLRERLRVGTEVKARLAARERQAKTMVMGRWRYHLKLRQLILKMIGKYCGRREIQAKSLALVRWHRVSGIISATNKAKAVHGAQEICVSLREDLETAQSALVESTKLADERKQIILQFTQRRLAATVAGSVKAGRASAFTRWVQVSSYLKQREQAAKSLLMLERRHFQAIGWRMWVVNEKEMRATEIREAYASQESMRRLLSEVELQRSEDVREVQRELELTSAQLDKHRLLVKGLVQHSLLHSSKRLQTAVIRAWQRTSHRRKTAVYSLSTFLTSHLLTSGLLRIRARARLHLSVSRMLRLSSHSRRSALQSALTLWLHKLLQVTHGLMSRQRLNGDGHISLLQSNLSSVKKKLRWKTMVSANEKRSWTVLKAWQQTVSVGRKLRVAGELFQLKQRQTKMKLAIGKLRNTWERNSKFRRLRRSGLSLYANKLKMWTFATIKARKTTSQRLNKGGKLLETRLTRKFQQFTLNKLVRFYCVVKTHLRWKLKNRSSSLKHCITMALSRQLRQGMSCWSLGCAVRRADSSLLRRVISRSYIRAVGSGLGRWKQAALREQAMTFTTSQSALAQDFKAVQSKALILHSILRREGLNSLEIRRLVEDQERELTGLTAIRTRSVAGLSVSALKDVKRKLKKAAGKVRNWRENWPLCHAFSTWKSTSRWLDSLPKHDLIQAVDLLSPPKGMDIVMFAKAKKQQLRRAKVVGALTMKLWVEGRLVQIWTVAKRFVLLERLGDLGKRLEDKDEDLVAARQSRMMLEREKAELVQALQQNKAEGVQSEAVTKILRELTTEREKLADELAHRSFTIRKLLEENAGLSVKLANAQMEAEKLILLSQEPLLPDHATFSSPLRYDDLRSNNY